MTKNKREQQLIEELEESYQRQTRRIQALRVDLDRALDGESRVILEERLLEAEKRRYLIVEQMKAFETIDAELNRATVPNRTTDLREISNYVIIGLETQHQLRPIFEMFARLPDAKALMTSDPDFEEIPFGDFSEMTEVFTALTRVLNNAKQRGGTEGALLSCLKDEVISQASEHVLQRNSASQPNASQSFGVEYMIWSVHKEWASVIRALRIKRILSGEMEIKRTSENEIAFDDIRRLQLMATTLQEAAVAGKNSPQDFLRLVLQGAMRAQLMDLS